MAALIMIPMNLFLTILPATTIKSSYILAADQSLGISLIVLVAVRLIWFVISLATPLTPTR